MKENSKLTEPESPATETLQNKRTNKTWEYFKKMREEDPLIILDYSMFQYDAVSPRH